VLAGGDGHGHGGEAEASRVAALATDSALNPDACLAVGGADAPTKAAANYQLAYGSQSPVTELAPSDKVVRCVVPSVGVFVCVGGEVDYQVRE
jgi:hypothetical protein